MHFTSYEFIFFLISLLVLYYIIPKKFQWILLLIASYIFYSFAGTKYIVYIVVTTISTYFASYKISKLKTIEKDYIRENKKKISRSDRKAYRAVMKVKQKRWLILCLVFNFGILGVVKYTNFVFHNINSLMDIVNVSSQLPLINIILPLGISFYTFQSMGYIIDIYRGKYLYEKNYFKLSLFISFFPQLIQGPINRFDELKESLFSSHSYDAKNVSFGVQRILWGFFKKLVVADRMLPAVTAIVGNPQQYQGVFVLVGIVFYAITIYADFTGGIDIAIGVAECFGIRLTENFNRPYFSKNVAEYWRRWHMSLGRWFREYMFYPISVSKPMLKLSRKTRAKLGDGIGKRIPVYIASVVVWFTVGIWHGAAWNFIVWGLLNCLVILVSQELTPLYRRFHNRFDVKDSFWFRLFQVGRTFWLMSFIRILDCYRDVGTTFRMYGTVFTKFNFNELWSGSLLDMGLSLSDYVIIIIAVMILIIISLIQRTGSVREKLGQRPMLLRYSICFILLVSILIFGAYGVGYDSSQFIYSQF